MKRLKISLGLLSVLTLSIFLNGCSIPKVKFDFASAAGYIQQKYEDNTPYYSLVLMVQVTTADLQSAKVYKDGFQIPCRVIANQIIELNESFILDPIELNGEYVVYAYNEANEEIQDVFIINADTSVLPFDPMEVEEFKYEDSKINMRMKTIKGIGYYGLYFNPVIKDFPLDSRINSSDYVTQKSSGDTQSIEYQLESHTINYESLRVNPMALYSDGTHTIVIILGEERTLKNGSTSFEEDNNPV